MKRTLLAVLLLSPVAALQAAEAKAARPNLIVILADDMGYSDPGCFGGEIATPAIDRLAREGMRLARFQNCGMCVISRVSLLTGQWWPRALPNLTRTPLLSEKLHQAGYRTALVGKWHLDGHPMDRGFDRFFGYRGGFSDHFAGSKDYQLDRKPFTEFGPGYYSADAFTERAIQFIQSAPAGESDKPFFLYLSYQAPHNPLQAPREEVLKYRGRYREGWQAVREARFRRQKEMGLVPARAELPAYPQNLPDWKSLSPEQKDLEDLRMAVFAAMIARMDQGIGRLVDALRQSGKAENTLILFLSDNGADSFSVMDAPLLKQGKLPGDPHSNWQLGTGWAYASVTPWRLYKISQHAGGVTTGAVAWWPGVIGQSGRVESGSVHMVDVLPTFLEVAGLPAGPEIAGESFLPLLRNLPWQRKSHLFFQFMDNRAIRTDQWSLTEVDGSGWELFQNPGDPLETKNLASDHSAIVADLDARWLRWWCQQNGSKDYQPRSTKGGPHYKHQGDRGSGERYLPSSMPQELAKRYPLP